MTTHPHDVLKELILLGIFVNIAFASYFLAAPTVSSTVLGYSHHTIESLSNTTVGMWKNSLKELSETK